MSKLVRKYSPRWQIVVGGYGTLADDELILPYADHICRTEGIAYMIQQAWKLAKELRPNGQAQPAWPWASP
jgi:hypothetical protein